jgi:hypothetical protein
MTREYIRKETNYFKCAVCDKELSVVHSKIKTMEFENGLVKNFIREQKEDKKNEYGVITELDGSEIYLCTEHFNTAWAIKTSSNTFRELVDLMRTENILVIEENNPAANEIKKEISESICNGNLEL